MAYTADRVPIDQTCEHEQHAHAKRGEHRRIRERKMDQIDQIDQSLLL